MDNISNKLLNLKKLIDEAKSKQLQMEGKLSNMTQQLKERHNISNVDKAKKEINKMKEELSMKKVEREKGIKQLEERIMKCSQ